jgi:diguanylate cyclase
MIFGIRRKGRTRWSPQLKILTWATMIGLICGVINFGEPFEIMLRGLRNRMAPREASGQIVVIAIDDESLAAVDKWPLPRRYHARIIDRLNELSAKQILFDINFSGRSNPIDDGLFEQSLANAHGKVTLAVMRTIDPITGKVRSLTTIPEFGEHAQLASINVKRNAFGQVWDMYYNRDVGEKIYPTMASRLSGTKHSSLDPFRVDYSVRLGSVPKIPFLSVLKKRVSIDQVRGKTVIIAPVSSALDDIFPLGGKGQSPGVYSHVLAAETLLRGTPIDLGWFGPMPFAFGAIGLMLFSARRRAAMMTVLFVVLAILFVPFILERQIVFVDIVPALFALIVASFSYGMLLIKQRSRSDGGAINFVSGLPNINAMRKTEPAIGSALVVARIHNFSAIAATLSSDLELALIEQITKRLSFGANASDLFQGDDGVFAWFSQSDDGSPVTDQLDAIHAMFQNSVTIGARIVDIDVSFGVCASADRSVLNRYGSALATANEAASEGFRWKVADPELLKDADWKLSLLGQLDAAIDGGQVWVAYQPKLDIARNRILGAEALVRWTHPQKGAINPEEFVLAAEQHNRIEKLTSFVLEHAIKAAAAINARGIEFDVAVNISARLLDNPWLVSLTKRLLIENGLEPARLTLEVTESAALNPSGLSHWILDELRDHGVKLSIDDYGTGFSTLEYLRKIPATEIKIDKSFIAMVDRNHSDRVMVKSTIELAHSLGRKVVAEGVERQETLDTLIKMGCDIAQGYLIGRPVAFRGLTRQLLTDQRKKAA